MKMTTLQKCYESSTKFESIPQMIERFGLTAQLTEAQKVYVAGMRRLEYRADGEILYTWNAYQPGVHEGNLYFLTHRTKNWLRGEEVHEPVPSPEQVIATRVSPDGRTHHAELWFEHDGRGCLTKPSDTKELLEKYPEDSSVWR